MVKRVSNGAISAGGGAAAALRELHCGLLAVGQHAGDRLIDEPAKLQQPQQLRPLRQGGALR